MTTTTQAAITVIAALWSVFCFLCGFSFGRRDEDHECFCSRTSSVHTSKSNDLLGQPRLRTDYSPSVDRKVTSDVDAFIKLRNQKVAENIGKDPPDHEQHL
jgi:hypothetical protein